jgi:ribosomal protein S3
MSLSSKAKEIYSLFEVFCDGASEYFRPITPYGTMAMGVTLLNYDENENTLHVHLRLPGRIIGKGGETIDLLRKELGCEISIHEAEVDGDHEMCRHLVRLCDDQSTTYTETLFMGVTCVEYDEDENTLHIHLRRPGLLIGKGGVSLESLQRELGSKIRIHEVRKLYKD